MPSMDDVDKTIRELKLYADRFPERIDKAKALIRDAGLSPGNMISKLEGVDNIVGRYDQACASKDPLQALVDIRQVFGDLETVISWYSSERIYSHNL